MNEKSARGPVSSALPLLLMLLVLLVVSHELAAKKKETSYYVMSVAGSFRILKSETGGSRFPGLILLMLAVTK
jgi:hypothetical protein